MVRRTERAPLHRPQHPRPALRPHVPPGAAVPISLAFATDGSQESVDALTTDARSAMLPAVAITDPADATTVTSATVTVTGTASDDGPVSVKVNGHAAAIAADRTWSGPCRSPRAPTR